MFKLNFKISLRNLWKNKVSSLINVIGLAIGLAACLMLLIYVSYEWNFDRQAKNAEQVHIAMTNITNENGKIDVTFDGTTTAFAPLIRAGIPELKYVARMNYGGKYLIANKENSFKRDGKFAEPDILHMYDYNFLSGDPKTAMSQPRSVILTESTARLLFGTTDALNKTVKYQDQENLSVTGVIKDLPQNSSNKFDYLMPWSFYELINEQVKSLNWDDYSYVTLVSLRPDANLAAVNKKIDELVKKNRKIEGQPHFLFPLSKMHLYGKFENGVSVGGAVEQIWLFMGLAIGILLIACVNFMNMATAKSEKRAKEVGIKKTIGATRSSLIAQFLIESLVLTAVSIVIAIALVEGFIPYFNNLLDIKMGISYFSMSSWLCILGIVIFTGILAGSYPAFYLSSFNPLQTLKKGVKAKQFFSISLRQLLIVGQFCFTVMLIICTMVIYRQIQYIKNKPLGIDSNALVEMPQDGALAEKYDVLKEQLLKSGAVSDMTQSSVNIVHHSSFFKGLEWLGISPAQRDILFNRVATSYDFIKTTGLKMLQGRDFSKLYASDTAGVLISASALKIMELKQPLGAELSLSGYRVHVVGVFEDYVWDSPYKTNAPLIIYFNKQHTENITMRLNAKNDLRQNMETITRITKNINPGYPVELSFTDASIEEMMQKEQRLGILSNLFGGLAIFISCLGLYGLVAYSAEQRTKEFGVRKVLGASVANLMQLLSVSFIKMIFIAIVIAVPLATYLMNNWLQNFEYRTNVSWWIIALASAGTLMIAMITLSYQAYKSAVSNPVDALKYE